MSGQRVILAEYFTTDDLTLLFIVRADFAEPKVFEIKTPLSQIRQFVTTRFGGTAEGSQVRDLDLPTWQENFGTFVEPLLQWTDEGDIIWLVPHDVLHYLPLHALKVEGRYLIERNPICYTPSASVMKYCHAKRKGRRQRALILADSRADRPLLHAQEQALAIQELFAPTAEVYLNGAATKRLVQQRLAVAKEEIDILHFACHGYFDRLQALQSGIMLAPENGRVADAATTASTADTEPADRAANLTAEQIFGLEMHADLVTLSACESGVNDRRPGDELIGLTRALIYAGTPSVVVSLWSVDEISTSILMRTFYQALQTGASKAAALQKAQVDLMRMTAKDVIAYCTAAKARLVGPEAAPANRLLEWDIADVQFAACDFTAALAGYTQLRAGVDPVDQDYQKLSVAMARCRGALRNPKPINDAICLYAHPYHWAPFVLVGDWQ